MRNSCIPIQLSSVAQLCPTLCHCMDCRRQASLPIINSRSLLKLMSIESVRPSNHLILCRPLLLPPSIFHSIRVFSTEAVLRIGWHVALSGPLVLSLLLLRQLSPSPPLPTSTSSASVRTCRPARLWPHSGILVMPAHWPGPGLRLGVGQPAHGGPSPTAIRGCEPRNTPFRAVTAQCSQKPTQAQGAPAPGRPSATGCGVPRLGSVAGWEVLARDPVGGSPPQASGRKQGLRVPSLSLSFLSVGGDGMRHLGLHRVVAGTCQGHRCWWTHAPRG